jgi:hypothetical protein
MAPAKPTFSPVCSEPFIISAEFRIRKLRELLSDKSQEYQKKNILALIDLYETGQLKPTSEITWIFDGKVVDSEPNKIPKGSAVWAEEISFQLMQTTQTHQVVPDVSK